MNPLSYSQITLFQTCPIKWYNKYYLNIKEPEVDNPSFIFGSGVHKLIEEKLRNNKEFDLNDLLDFQKLKNPDDDRSKAIDLAGKAIDLVQKNDLSVGNDFTFINFGIEEKIEYPDFVGVIDCVAKDKNGKTYIIDWKTTSTIYTPHQLRTSDQLTCYSWLLHRKYDIVADYVCYVTMNKKSGIVTMYKTIRDMDDILYWDKKVSSIHKQIDYMLLTKNPSACIGEWDTCYYYNKCWNLEREIETFYLEKPKFGGLKSII